MFHLNSFDNFTYSPWPVEMVRLRRRDKEGQTHAKSRRRASGKPGLPRRARGARPTALARKPVGRSPRDRRQIPPGTAPRNFFHFFSKTPLRGPRGFDKLLIRSPPTRGNPVDAARSLISDGAEERRTWMAPTGAVGREAEHKWKFVWCPRPARGAKT